LEEAIPEKLVADDSGETVVAEETVVKDSAVEEAISEESVVDDSPVEEVVAKEPVDSAVADTAAEELVVGDSVAEERIAEDHVAPDSKVEEAPAVEEEPADHGPAVSWRETEDEIEEEPAFSESVGEPISVPSESVEESGVFAQEKSLAEEAEPVAQGQPIPYQVPAFLSESTVAEFSQTKPDIVLTDLAKEEITHRDETGRSEEEFPPFVPQVISTEPLAHQPTIPAMMPQTMQPTPVPIRTAPMTGAAPQPTSGMQTAVQLTFSFEIASLQLTPSFKMGALQLKPTSKIVTMRLAPSQQPQPAMNLQVTFEVSSVQLAGNSLGVIRLIPSQQQRPSVINTPAFNIAGLQLLSGADSAVQLTPSQQGQASVHVTGRFQISTVEFSPSFEISSIVLNSTSKNVSVQLPGAGPSAVEGAPVFEITNVQLGGNGEIGTMQLNSQGLPPKPA
jgi:hypothetical protein